VLISGEIVSPSSDDAASLAKHWMTLSRSSFTSPNAPKHRGIIVLPWKSREMLGEEAEKWRDWMRIRQTCVKIQAFLRIVL